MTETRPGALASARSEAPGETPEVREEVYDPDLEVTIEAGDNSVTVTVSSEVSPGATIVINVDSAVVPISSLEELEVLVDNENIELADDYEDVLDTTDENASEYLILVGAEGIQVLVSIPHFSVHTITLGNVAAAAPPERPPNGGVTPPAEGIPIGAVLAVAGAVLVAIVSAAVLHLRQARGDATSELIKHGLSSMSIQDADIFREIREHKEFTIPELMQKTGATKTVASYTIQKLIKKGLVKPTGEVKLPEAGRGKPSRVYRYVSD